MPRFGVIGRLCTVSLVAAAWLGFGLSSDVQAVACDAGDATHLVICLNHANPNLATQGSGPYGEFTITAVSTTSYKVVATGLNSFVFGDSSILGLNLNTSVTGAGTLTAQAGFTQAKAGNVDGFGSFNFLVDDGPGFSSPLSTFTLNFTTANAATLATLLTPNGAPNNATGVAHMALSTNTACTGFASDGINNGGTSDNSACTTVVPEPATLLLVGTLLAGLGYISRQRLASGFKRTV